MFSRAFGDEFGDEFGDTPNFTTKLVTYLMTILVNRRAYLFINKMANFVKTILVANLVNHQIG